MPTIEVGHHCFAATGLMPRAVQSRAIEATDSPCSSTRVAASRIASASTGLMSSRTMCRFLWFGSSGFNGTVGYQKCLNASSLPSYPQKIAVWSRSISCRRSSMCGDGGSCS